MPIGQGCSLAWIFSIEIKIWVVATNDAKEWLAKRGFDSVLGARPMSRLIQKEIKDKLADEILFGKLKQGGLVNISIKDDKLEFEF